MRMGGSGGGDVSVMIVSLGGRARTIDDRPWGLPCRFDNIFEGRHAVGV